MEGDHWAAIWCTGAISLVFLSMSYLSIYQVYGVASLHFIEIFLIAFALTGLFTALDQTDKVFCLDFVFDTPGRSTRLILCGPCQNSNRDLQLCLQCH